MIVCPFEQLRKFVLDGLGDIVVDVTHSVDVGTVFEHFDEFDADVDIFLEVILKDSVTRRAVLLVPRSGIVERLAFSVDERGRDAPAVRGEVLSGDIDLDLELDIAGDLVRGEDDGVGVVLDPYLVIAVGGFDEEGNVVEGIGEVFAELVSEQVGGSLVEFLAYERVEVVI